MDKNFLLTYTNGEHEKIHWFETEQEMLDFIEEQKNAYGDKFEIFDALLINEYDDMFTTPGWTLYMYS